MSKRHRSAALIATHDDRPPSRHFAGAPAAAGIGGAAPQRLPWPRIVVLIERDDGFFLERLLPNGTVVGDTSHEDAQEAREQAEWEYGALLGAWFAIPEHVDENDIPAFLLGVRP